MELEKSNLNKLYTLIEYPGIVKNVDRALETLGGVNEISKVCAKKNRRLELRFRPDDAFCKPACGDRYDTHGLILKVKFVKKRTDDGGESIAVRGCEIFGRISKAYKFKSICDFQILPMNQNSSGEMESIIGRILPLEVDGNKLESWLEEPTNLFLPPAGFSRIDTQSKMSYMYRQDNKGDSLPPGALIGRTRKRRSGHAIFVSFSNPKIPMKPREIASKYLKVKFLTDEAVDVLKKLFEERPIWSKLALMCVTGFTNEQLKYLLPVVAYYFVTGPFRVMWVRIGYDPRVESEARIYQTLDYRIRAPAGLVSFVKAKRSHATYMLPTKINYSASKSISIKKDLEKIEQDVSNKKIKKDAYIFKPDTLPAARQMFYQYIDVKVPEIEGMFGRLPKVSPQTTCHPKHGWLPPRFDSQCRDIMNNFVLKLLQREAAAGIRVESPNLKDIDGDEEGADDSTDNEAEWEEEFDEDEVDNDSDEGDENNARASQMK